MVEKPTKRGRPSAKTLAAIGSALEEIQVYFGWSDQSSVITERASNSSSDEVGLPDPEELDDDEDEDYEDESDSDGYVDREEIEVAIDSFRDTLMAEGIIKKSRSGKPPSFGGIFKNFFGAHHGIVAKALEFEKTVEGYSGWISPESMNEAEKMFLEIRQFVQNELKA